MTTINFDAPQEVTCAGIIAWLTTADALDSASRNVQLVDQSKWKGLGAVGRRVLEGHTRAVNDNNFAPETCPRCFGSGMEVAPADIPLPSAVSHKNPIVAPAGRRCRCEITSARAQRLQTALNRIPPRYQGAELATLTPQPSRHPLQAQIVSYMKAHPSANYFLCGKPDTGKTHLYWTLYRHAASADRMVFASTLFKLIEAIKAHLFDSSRPQPLPNLDDFASASIFLEDVNKARPTEFAAERFYNFLDDIYNNKQHQLVVTSQLGPEDLVTYFERDDNGIRTVDGAAIVRRMVNNDTSEWRMF